MPLARMLSAVPVAVSVVLPMPAPKIASVFVRLIPAAGKLPAAIWIVSPLAEAVTARASVLQFGELVVQVFEPSPGTSHVVAAAAGVANAADTRSPANRMNVIGKPSHGLSRSGAPRIRAGVYHAGPARGQGNF